MGKMTYKMGWEVIPRVHVRTMGEKGHIFYHFGANIPHRSYILSMKRKGNPQKFSKLLHRIYLYEIIPRVWWLTIFRDLSCIFKIIACAYNGIVFIHIFCFYAPFLNYVVKTPGKLQILVV